MEDGGSNSTCPKKLVINTLIPRNSESIAKVLSLLGFNIDFCGYTEVYCSRKYKIKIGSSSSLRIC